jgi:hypothetical protein
MEEEGRLVRLEKGEEYMTPVEREAAAKPVYAGAYWKPFNGLRAATLLWPDEVALVDGTSRDKKDKKSIGKRTSAVQKWFKELSQSRKDEAENAAKKWNFEGAPDKERMHP